MAYTLCEQMTKPDKDGKRPGYSMTQPDIDGITPVFILYCNMLKSYNALPKMDAVNEAEFRRISGAVLQWSLDSSGLSCNLALLIGEIIIAYAHYEVADVKRRNWELENEFVNRWVFCCYDENYWKTMLQQQEKRLRQKERKQETRQQRKKQKQSTMIDAEKKRVYALQHAAVDGDDGDGD
eukprot:CAMPEP_0202701710 /NCGR_PEP_ID=MMETSP1385-20130828/14777_1 /ASSEMBLY_ACC=CAM_ASM_000861 /TAXON_ID=933848 /ORGANISM="Elphidium margaritaceum" /LENGTH=180 /DNA_ID=CAMNT_0049359187 /DNA_START=78 /DNA_END=617 /DNA_ORIENTATION=+